MDSQNLNFEENQINFYRQQQEHHLEEEDQDDFNSLEELG